MKARQVEDVGHWFNAQNNSFGWFLVSTEIKFVPHMLTWLTFNALIFCQTSHDTDELSFRSKWSFYLTTRPKSYLTPQLSLSTLKIIEIDCSNDVKSLTYGSAWNLNISKTFLQLISSCTSSTTFFLPHFDCSVSALMVNTNLCSDLVCVYQFTGISCCSFIGRNFS